MHSGRVQQGLTIGEFAQLTHLSVRTTYLVGPRDDPEPVASERAGNVTGADYVIDGGLLTTL